MNRHQRRAAASDARCLRDTEAVCRRLVAEELMEHRGRNAAGDDKWQLTLAGGAQNLQRQSRGATNASWRHQGSSCLRKRSARPIRKITRATTHPPSANQKGNCGSLTEAGSLLRTTYITAEKMRTRTANMFPVHPRTYPRRFNMRAIKPSQPTQEPLHDTLNELRVHYPRLVAFQCN